MSICLYISSGQTTLKLHDESSMLGVSRFLRVSRQLVEVCRPTFHLINGAAFRCQEEGKFKMNFIYKMLAPYKLKQCKGSATFFGLESLQICLIQTGVSLQRLMIALWNTAQFLFCPMTRSCANASKNWQRMHRIFIVPTMNTSLMMPQKNRWTNDIAKIKEK